MTGEHDGICVGIEENGVTTGLKVTVGALVGTCVGFEDIGDLKGTWVGVATGTLVSVEVGLQVGDSVGIEEEENGVTTGLKVSVGA